MGKGTSNKISEQKKDSILEKNNTTVTKGWSQFDLFT